MHSNKESISVIIPTINRKDVLLDTLYYLNLQVGVEFEVIIIDQSDSNLLSSNELSEFKYFIKYYKSENKNASHARNIGILESKYDVVLILDDDVIIEDKRFLYNHIINYREKLVDGVFGQVLQRGKKPTGKRNFLSKSNKFGWMFFPPNYNARVELFGIGMAGNLSFRKEKALKVGAMDENYIKGAYREESDFLMRMYMSDAKIVFDPLCSLNHIGNNTGGIRSWKKDKLRPYHHCVSEWYFNFKYSSNSGYLISLYSVVRRQLVYGDIIRNPFLLPSACYQFFSSFISAFKLYKSGSKYIDKTSYDFVERLF